MTVSYSRGPLVTGGEWGTSPCGVPGRRQTAAETTRLLDRENPDHAPWFKKFDDAVATCRK